MKTPNPLLIIYYIVKLRYVIIGLVLLIIISQIPIIKTYLNMITATEAIMTIIVSAGLYTACEMIYKKRKNQNR